jgi:hypothetical protein
MNWGTKMTDPTDDELELFFSAARQTRPAPSSDLLTRVEAQALQNMPLPLAQATPVQGLWSHILNSLGGWGGMTGLTAATAAGILLGVYPPDFLSDNFSVLISGSETFFIDPPGSFGFESTEG